MKQQFLISTSGTFQTYIYEDNLKAIPTSATITVYKPGGEVVLVDDQAMIVGSDGILSYALTVDNNDIADMSYRAVVTYVLNSVTTPVTIFYDIVNSILHTVITDEDIVNELPQLRDNGWKTHGTAESGSSTTIVDTELNHFLDDHFTGGLAYSADKNETRKITDFIGSTGTVTTEAFGSAIATDKYILTRSFTKEIQRAFDKLVDMLKRDDKFAHLILDSDDLKETHIILAAAEITKGIMKNEAEGGFWWELWQDYKKDGRAMFKSLNLKYDTSDDGFISESEEEVRLVKRTGRG